MIQKHNFIVFAVVIFAGTAQDSFARDNFFTRESYPAREAVIDTVLNSYEQETGSFLPKAWKTSVKVTGVVRTSIGIDSNGDSFLNRANADLNEKNFRIISTDALNNKENTFDPAIYQRIKLVVDAAVEDAVGMHMNVTVDPWSFTGKTNEVTLQSGNFFVDKAAFQYLAWGNSAYTVNRIVYTQRLGDSVALPEVKIKDNKVPQTVVKSNFGLFYIIPESKINWTFWPLRELWFDLKPTDEFSLRVFPMAYQDQALTSDDPLKLSNNRTWWEESPWLRDWRPGILNVGVPEGADFTKGEWDRSLAFFTRDSDGTRLTALRGMSINFHTEEGSYLKATAATPKTLWQDYGEVTAVPASVRIKQFLSEQLFVGGLASAHLGYVEGKRDAQNYVGSVDVGLSPMEGLELNAQVSSSQSRYDLTNTTFASRKTGQAYYVSVESSSDHYNVLNRDYYALAPNPKMPSYKTRIFYGQMDKNFESTLSNYHETRDDAYWSRHLTFYPSLYRNLPGTQATMGEADLLPFAIGNGLDYGRKVVGWRGDAIIGEGLVKAMADVRHVMTTENKKVETVGRTAWTVQMTDQLTAEAFGLTHWLPKTEAGVDPFIVDGNTGEPLLNNAIEAGKDPSLNTASLGARYALTDQIIVNGVWEHTNDFTLSEDNFPRGDLNSSSFATFTENGHVYRKVLPFLYDQNFFEQPPYRYRNIYKTGLLLKPTDQWEVYIDYTHNPNRFMGNIDDNMNHVGLETSYVPTRNWGFFARYTFSKWNSLYKLVNDGVVETQNYSNLFLETRYMRDSNTRFYLQYGVGPAFLVDTSFTNPALGYYATPTLETERFIRASFEKKF